MKLSYGNNSVRLACATKAALQRAFRSMWHTVQRCLNMLLGVETLNELTSFDSVTLRRVRSTFTGVAEFVMSFGSVELRLRADAINDGHDEIQVPRGIRQVCLTGIYVTAAAGA